MKDHGALFKADMVLALLDGRKTQTRRTRGLEEVNKDPNEWNLTGQSRLQWTGDWRADFVRFVTRNVDEPVESIAIAPWSPGDMIYAKETHIRTAHGTIYRADLSSFDAAGIGALYGGWKPSIFMPRALSRYRARVTAVRCERLQDITEADAKAEGISLGTLDRTCFPGMYAMAYARLWDAINGPGSWDRNPWVFAYMLERIK